MRTSIIPSNEFQRDKFASLLIECKGKSTVDSFAKKCNVSVAYMSRLLNCKQNNPPVLKTLFSFHKAIGIPFDKLGLLAGYSQDDIAKYQSNQQITSTLKDYNFHFCIYKTLSSAPFEWQEKKSPNPRIYHITLNNCFYSDWIFYNMLDAAGQPPEVLSLAIPLTYSDFMFSQFNSKTKISIVVNSQDLFDYLVKRNPFSLGVYVSIVLINSNIIVDEKHLETLAPFHPDMNDYMLLNFIGNSMSDSVDYLLSQKTTN